MSSQKQSKLEAAGPFLRDIVFGVHDALLTNIGIVTGFVTALQNRRLIVAAALIDVIISAFAMAFGTYLSRKSESDYWEGQLEHTTQTDLKSVLAEPVNAATVMWFTYVISGMVPLIPFFFNLDSRTTLQSAISLALVTFFGVGLLKGAITKTSIWRSGLQFVLFGAFAALVGYVVGYYGQRFIGQS